MNEETLARDTTRNAETNAALQRFLPIRVILRVQEGKVEGLVEHSFGMGWSEKVVNISWSGKAYSILGEHMLDSVKETAEQVKQYYKDALVFDPLLEDSPIEVDWVTWLAATDKFGKRNAPFKVKPFGDYVLRAMRAEKLLTALEIAHEKNKATIHSMDEKLQAIERLMGLGSEE